MTQEMNDREVGSIVSKGVILGLSELLRSFGPLLLCLYLGVKRAGGALSISISPDGWPP